MKTADIRAAIRRAIAGGASQARVQWLAIRSTPRYWPRRTPAWTNASYARAMAKKKRQRAARRAAR